MSNDETRPSSFELIRDALLQLDPETRAEVIAAMEVFRTLPAPVATRVLLDAARRSQLLYAPRRLLVTPN